MARVQFDWQDPFALRSLLTDEERMIMAVKPSATNTYLNWPAANGLAALV